MDRWEDASTWVGDGVRREVFFFPSRGVELYGSLYASAQPTHSLGVVVCPSWGVEGDLTETLVHVLALEVARLGGAALTFHYPGVGESWGRIEDTTMDSLATAAADAARAAAAHSHATDWMLAGYSFGASVACLARPAAGVPSVLLLQPALRPSVYFARLTRRAQSAPGGSHGMRSAFGYPIPERIVEAAYEADAAVAAALPEGVSIRHELPPERNPLPRSMEEIVLPSRWSLGARRQFQLEAAVKEWLAQRMAAPSEVAGEASP